MGRVLTNGPGDIHAANQHESYPSHTKLDATLLNTQHYKAHIKGKVEQSWENSSALRYTSV